MKKEAGVSAGCLLYTWYQSMYYGCCIIGREETALNLNCNYSSSSDSNLFDCCSLARVGPKALDGNASVLNPAETIAMYQERRLCVLL